jgi:hypothetical protein
MRDIVPALGVVLVALGLVGWLVQGQGVGEPLIPGPANAVQGFLKALSAGRYEIAYEQLADDLRAEIEVSAVETMDQDLQYFYGDYDFELGGETEQQGDEMVYYARLRTSQGEAEPVSFVLARNPETRLWEIVWLSALRGHRLCAVC